MGLGRVLSRGYYGGYLYQVSPGQNSPKPQISPDLAYFPYLAAKRACARLGWHLVLMIEFEGVQLRFRWVTFRLVSLRSHDYAESSCEIERDLGGFRV